MIKYMKGPVCMKTAIIVKVEVEVKEKEEWTKEGKMKEGGVAELAANQR